jgi:hypothetical protein
MYVKVICILLLLSGLIAGLWKLYDAGGDAREAEVRLEFSTKENQAKQEILRLQQQIANQRQQAEAAIKAERQTWEKRVNAIKHISRNCSHPDILAGLRDAGIYTGPIPCK